VLSAAGLAQNPPGPAAAPPPAGKAANPLPAGAAVRLGSADLRHPAHLTELRFTPDNRAVVSYGSGVTRHWDARTGRQLPAQTTDITPTTAWNFSTADGSAVVAVHLEFTPPYGRTVRRYDAATGRHEELFALPDRKAATARYAPFFTLAPDGGLLAAGDADAGATTVWDLKTRRPRFTIESPDGHLLFTPDGKHLLTAGGDSRMVRFWDTQTGKQTRSLGRDGGRLPKSGLVRLVISPDCRWVAGVDNNHLIDHGTEVTVWDLDRPDRPRVLTVPEGFGHSGAPAFGPDGAVYTVTDPFKRWLSVVSRWDTATGERLAQWDGPKPDWRGGLTAAVSPDGSAVAVGTYAGAISLYDAKTGKVLAAGGSHAARVVGVAFDPNGRDVQTAAEDGSAATWDARTGETKARRDPPDVDRTRDTTGAVLSPDGRWLLTHATRPGGAPEAVVWDAATGEKRFTREVAVQVKELLPVPGGDLLVCRFDVTGGEAVEVWDAATGAAMPPILRTFERGRARFAVTPAGPTLVACDQESVVGYDPRTGKEQFAWKLTDRGVPGPLPKDKHDSWWVSAVAASPDGKTLAVAVGGPAYIDVSKRTDSLVLVETRTGQVIRRVATPETLAGWLVFSPDGRRLAGPRCVWDVATLAELRRFPARPEVTAAAFSPDGSQVATGHANGTALVWPLGP
jgi:WD40 repeat protein